MASCPETVENHTLELHLTSFGLQLHIYPLETVKGWKSVAFQRSVAFETKDSKPDAHGPEAFEGCRCCSGERCRLMVQLAAALQW